jgi:hypothetical protein
MTHTTSHFFRHCSVGQKKNASSELQSVIELEFSYFNFFHEINSYRVTDSIKSYYIIGFNAWHGLILAPSLSSIDT